MALCFGSDHRGRLHSTREKVPRVAAYLIAGAKASSIPHPGSKPPCLR
jgi:hypothetical protein